MEESLREKLTKLSQERQAQADPSHDFQHILRVTNLAEEIARSVEADPAIFIAAALFHDTVVYPKNSAQSHSAADESAQAAADILAKVPEFPQEKIPAVVAAIKECSFRKGIAPSSIESQVLQDADRLEATGAIAIMRTFSSSGQMNRQFYDPTNPFGEKGEAFSSALELFYNRLLKIESTLHTDYARTIAKHRTKFLYDFLQQLQRELQEAKII